MKKLLIAEKKSQATDYAKALNCKKGNLCFISDEYIITWLQGHLLRKETPYDVNPKYKKWDISHLPYPTTENYLFYENNKYLFDNIVNILKKNKIDTIINGGDCGREGELIQRLVLNHLPKELIEYKKMKRLWILSLTEEAILEGMKNLIDFEDKNLLYEEALTRAEIDMQIGLNYTTLVSCYLGTTAKMGRVKTSIMNIIRLRNKEREEFVKETFFVPSLVIDSVTFPMITEEKFKKEEAIEILNNIKKIEIKSDETKEKKKSPPLLYNLAKLQGDCAKLYKFKMDKTLSIAQDLYDKHKILSYPRTDSQYITLGELEKLKLFFIKTSYVDFKMNLDKTPRSVNPSKVTDHHGFIPIYSQNFDSTYKNLNSDEKNVMDLIIQNTALQFCLDYIYIERNVVLTSNNHDFSCNFKEVKELGFKKYTSKEKIETLPILNLNSNFEKKILEKETKIKSLYNVETLANKLEKNMIGQSATRTPIINELEKEGYIIFSKNSYEISEKGKIILDNINLDIKNPNFTTFIEEKLKEVREGKISRNQLLKFIEISILNNIEKYKNTKLELDFRTEKEKSGVKCPKCNEQILKSEKGWFYCSNKECKTFFPTEFRGSKITFKNLNNLLKNQKIEKKFKKKGGGEYKGYIKLKNYKYEFEFKINKKGE